MVASLLPFVLLTCSRPIDAGLRGNLLGGKLVASNLSANRIRGPGGGMFQLSMRPDRGGTRLDLCSKARII